MIQQRLIVVQLSTLLFVATITTGDGFGFTRLQQNCHRTMMSSSLLSSKMQLNEKKKGGWFDFDPFTGFGSGKDDSWKDEQWEAQQAILKAREDRGLTKEELASKYKKVVKIQQDLEYNEPGLSRQETMMKNKNFAKQVTKQYNAAVKEEDIKTTTTSTVTSTTASPPPSFAFFASVSSPSKSDKSDKQDPEPVSKSKSSSSSSSPAAFEMPKLEIPKFKMPWDK